MNIKNKIMSLLCLAALSGAQAQVQKVGYGLKYNADTKLFDCYMKVEKGQTLLTKHRIQFNAQVSIIVPNGSTIGMAQNHMPLLDNIAFRGSKPSKWNISNSVKNVTNLDNADVFSIVPSLTPTAFYNDLKEGDEVKLFSISVSPLPKCGEGVRLFDNEKDPSSADRSMHGGDFKNGFTIGSAEQKYAHNYTNENALLPAGELVAASSALENDNVTIQAGDWTNAASYQWNGPNGFVSNHKNLTIKNVSVAQAGKYTLTVTSDLGCTVKKSTMLEVQSIEALTKDNAVGKTEIENARNFNNGSVQSKIFPNPVTDNINISVEAQKGASVVASIYDNTGKIVMSNIINQKMEGNLLEKNVPLKLTSGVYSMKVTVNGQDTDHRFICIE